MSYTDLTTRFKPTRRLRVGDFSNLIGNDQDIHIEATTKMTFYQSAAPDNWTKETSQNDKALRVVSGTGGGTGGSENLSSGITLAHSHTANSHTHDFPNHSHTLDADGPNSSWVPQGDYVGSSNSDGATLYLVSTGGGDTVRLLHIDTDTSGNHTSAAISPGADSQLSNFVFAYADVILCSKDSGDYSDMAGEFAFEVLGTYQLYNQLADNDANDHWPDETKMPFVQAAVPTNWTKQTTVNDKLLRVVSGSGASTGGSHSPSSSITLAHSHTIDSHTHDTNNHQHILDYDLDTSATIGNTIKSLSGDNQYLLHDSSGTNLTTIEMKNRTDSDGDGYASDGTSPGTDSQLSNITLAYYDCIIGEKASGDYTDLLSGFTYKQLISWQEMDALAENDADNRLPNTTACPFFQASAPTNWTKDTSENDIALRVVSGSGGGTGGTLNLSTNFTLNHSHTVNAHTHDLGDHVHNLEKTTVSETYRSDAYCANKNNMYMREIGNPYQSGVYYMKNATESGGGGGASGNASDDGTDSQLTDTTLAYIDVIVCTKD